jgi:phage-related protein
MHPKPVVWLGSTLATVRALPDMARKDIGYALDRIQHGMEPSNWKPMAAVGLEVAKDIAA